MEKQISIWFSQLADSGPGIPPEIQARIFEPFFTTKPVDEGTGLGLSLCQGIVEGHGGAIRVDSEPGKGATFVVELPLTTPRAREPEVARHEDLLDVRGRNILVVDDEPMLRELLSDLLGLNGHHVEVAADGEEALEKVGGRAFDLILSDVKMPGLDGPALYREAVRRHPELGPRFVFVTGDLLTTATREFLEQIEAPSLGKPFTWDEVRRVVAQVLGRS